MMKTILSKSDKDSEQHNTCDSCQRKSYDGQMYQITVGTTNSDSHIIRLCSHCINELDNAIKPYVKPAKNIIDTWVRLMEEEQYEVNYSRDYSQWTKRERFEISKRSPAGYDFRFAVTMDYYNIDNLRDNLRYYDNHFDTSKETYFLLGKDGHGRNGVPYDMKDAYHEMEICHMYIYKAYELLKQAMKECDKRK